MTQYDSFIKNKPECFGMRRDSVPSTAPCGQDCGCVHNVACLSAVWSVLDAVQQKKLPDNGYTPSHLHAFRKRHNYVCQHYRHTNDIPIPFEVVRQLHSRVLPHRSAAEIETDLLLDDGDDLDAGLDALLEGLAVPAAEMHDGITTAVAPAAAPSADTSLAAAVMPAVLVGPAAGGATAVYKFPMPDGRPYQSDTNEQLAAALSQLVFKGFDATPASGYAAVRADLCALHIEMNLRQQHAPHFRPMQGLQKILDTPDERNAARDRQVIDIHWCAHSAHKPQAQVDKYPTLFNTAPFDVAAADRFAQEIWTPASKATHLHLSEEMQWQNAIIHIPAIRSQWHLICQGDARGHIVKHAGAPHIEQTLRNAVSRSNKPGTVKHIPGMVEAWKARRIVGDSPKKVACMIALMTGKKLRNDRAVQRTLQSLDSYLGGGKKAKVATTCAAPKRGRNSSADSSADTRADSKTDIMPDSIIYAQTQ